CFCFGRQPMPVLRASMRPSAYSERALVAGSGGVGRDWPRVGGLSGSGRSAERGTVGPEIAGFLDVFISRGDPPCPRIVGDPGRKIEEWHSGQRPNDPARGSWRRRPDRAGPLVLFLSSSSLRSG